MRFNHPRRRPRPEAVVPMINVVFLLLIFFMMSARIAPPPPFDVSLPATASNDALDEDVTLYVARDGQLSFNGQRGEAAWVAMSAKPVDADLIVRADATLPAKDMAALLARLAATGIDTVTLAVSRP